MASGSNARAPQGATAAMESKERSEALAQMQLTKIVRAYILQMITGVWGVGFLMWERHILSSSTQQQQQLTVAYCQQWATTPQHDALSMQAPGKSSPAAYTNALAAVAVAPLQLLLPCNCQRCQATRPCW